MTRPLILLWRNLYLVNTLVGDELNARLAAEAGCSLVEHDLLAWLSAAPGQRLRMLDLARRLRITPGGLTRVTDRLVERGWVEREIPAGNRREVYAILSDSGVAVLKAARSNYSRVLRETLGRHLDEQELEALAAMTGKLVEGLAATRPEPTG
jgi:DNA-binding MarR family transcriptional regulator